jgi:hypothetical protein
LFSRTTAHEFAEEISAWRRLLPDDLLPNRVGSWDSTNVWILILLAFSYRLECIFYRTVREHFRQSSKTEYLSWCKQQLVSCVFELDTVMNRLIVHDLVDYAPSSL